jgi:hypothetical protein
MKITRRKEPTFNDDVRYHKKGMGEYQKGNSAVVWKNPKIDLKAKYNYKGKRNLGYKVFYRSEYTPKLEDFKWKPEDGKNLQTSTIIQNLFWMEGMAPRVLDIIEFKSSEKLYYAQVIELMEKDEFGPWTDEALEKFYKFIKERHIKLSHLDMGPFHCFRDKFVDFSDFWFLDGYEKGLIERLTEDASYGGGVYQSVPELGIEGIRNLEERTKVLDFDNAGFKNKTALVYGCSGGFTCREIAKRGASRVVGLDYPKVARVAQELAFYLGHNNIDYYGIGNDYKKIKKLTGLSQFDIVTYLACFQVGWPTYLKEMVKEVFYLEGHKQQEEKTHKKLLKGIFPKVKYLGQVTDNGSRPAYRCTYE